MTLSPRDFATGRAFTSVTRSDRIVPRSPRTNASVSVAVDRAAISPEYVRRASRMRPSVRCARKRPIFSASPSHGACSRYVSASIDGRLTALMTTPCRSASATCSAIASATAVWASSVAAPRCGVTITCSSPSSGWSGGGGSCSKTSSAAPATCPARIASASARSSTMPPRAQLMIRTPDLTRASASSPSRWRVSPVSGTWIVMKSARASSSSSSTASTPWRSAASRVR